MRSLETGASRIGHGECHLPKIFGSVESMSQLDAVDPAAAHHSCRAGRAVPLKLGTTDLPPVRKEKSTAQATHRRRFAMDPPAFRV